MDGEERAHANRNDSQFVGSKPLASVLADIPDDLGGIYARKGFGFQDDVAASFYIEMLCCDDLAEVACETHDDVRLIWKRQGEAVVEFVQVKAEHPEQLWTVAKLCERVKSPTRPGGAGSSLLERSLDRDRYKETSWFRVVTCRQVNSELELLVTLERGSESRALADPRFKVLADNIVTRIPAARSRKGNNSFYWLVNARWDVVAERDIKPLNITRLYDVLHRFGFPCDPDTAKSMYGNFLALAKDTAEYGREKWHQKSISRAQLVEKFKQWLNPFPELGKPERLDQKLSGAGLDETCRKVALDQRRRYLQKRREVNYLSVEQIEDIDYQVLDVLHALRSSLDAGLIVEDGVTFHATCLKAVGAQHGTGPASDSVLMPGYLPGCMYEIAARCRHRFTPFRS